MRQLEETLLLLAGQDRSIDIDEMIDRIERDLSEEGVPVVVWDGSRIMQTQEKPIQETPRRIAKRAWVFAAAFIAVVIAIGIPVWLHGRDGSEDVVAESTTPVELLTFRANGPPNLPAGVAWSPDGAHLATAGEKTVKVWDATTGVELLHIDAPDPDPNMTRVAFSADSTRIATAAGVYDAATGARLLGPLPETFLGYSPDGTRIVVGGAYGWAAILNTATGEEQFLLPFAPKWVSAAAWSPDGTLIATEWGPGIRVWDGRTGDYQLALASTVDDVEDIAWSPDGASLATAGEESVKVWDAMTGEESATLTGHTGKIWTVAWSPDGTRLATAGSDGTARIWDAASGDELAVLGGHDSRVTDVVWSPDGTRIATITDHGTVKVWQVLGSTPREVFDFEQDSMCDWFTAEDMTRIVADAQRQAGTTMDFGVEGEGWWCTENGMWATGSAEVRLSHSSAWTKGTPDYFIRHDQLDEAVTYDHLDEASVWGILHGMTAYLAVEGHEEVLEIWVVAHSTGRSLETYYAPLGFAIASTMLEEMGWVD